MSDLATASKEKSNESTHVHAGRSSKLGMSDLKTVETNVQALASSIIWLEELMRLRAAELDGGTKINIDEYAEKIDKNYLSDNTSLHRLLTDYNNSYIEYLLISLGFAAWFRPKSLGELAKAKPDTNDIYSETGLLSSKASNKYIPTLQTALFLLAGTNITKQAYFHSILLNHALFKDQVLHLRKPSAYNNFPNEHILEFDLAYYNYLLNGKKPRYDASPDFPASLLETSKDFSDLVLKQHTKTQLDTIMNYAANRSSLFSREGVESKIKPGLIAMLYGPPGTGKTFTVSVISKELGIDAYRIDLSRIISKYIGETEKNLEKIFERLSDKNCILFFDEADALFGKRTEVGDAKDRYANQEVAYLLQRVENFPGLVILASNFKQNLDAAFKRRILVSIYLAPPDSDERLILWNNSLPKYFKYAPENLPDILAEKHPFTGSNIANIIKLSCIQAESEKTDKITIEIMEPFIKQEYLKEGLTGKKVNHSRLNI
jgi:AAA+ superfamily predicted ATPase